MQVCHRNRLTAYSLRSLNCAVCQLSALRSWTHCHNSRLTGFDPWRTVWQQMALQGCFFLLCSHQDHTANFCPWWTRLVSGILLVFSPRTHPFCSVHLGVQITSVDQHFFLSSRYSEQTFSTCPAVCSPKLHKHSGIAGRFILFVCVVQFIYFHPLLSLNNCLM